MVPAGAGVAALGIFVAVWFQPQKLFIDDAVDEAAPVGVTTATSSAPAMSPGASGPSTSNAPQTTIVASGRFRSLDHGTDGTVHILDVGGSRVVRLEDLDTSNGPDLFLYLSANPAGGDEGAFDDDFVNLGRLKGNSGNQNYDLPAGVDLGRYRSVVVWCDRFNSAFGAADLAR